MGTSHRERDIIMAKKIIKRKPTKSLFDLQVGDVIHDEDADADYWSLTGTDYFIGYDEELKHFVYDPDSESGWDHLPGWAWYADRSTMLRDFARFLGNEAPLPAVASKPDAGTRRKTHVLVSIADAPYHPRFPLVNPELGLPEATTFYRMTKDMEFVCMVTVDVDGLHLAWDACGGCTARVNRCRCPKGSVPPRAIIWCCTGSATKWEGKAVYQPSTNPTGNRPGAVSAPVRTTKARTLAPVTPDSHKALTKAASAPAKPATGMLADLDRGDFDLGAVAKAAQADADSQTKAVRRVIKKKGK